MIEDILKTEFSEDFARGMRERMVVSYYKYGPVSDGFPEKIDAIATLREKVDLYMRGNPAKGIAPGNTEYLMDVANYAMIEFMHPRHDKAHFKATDDDGSTGRRSTVFGGGMTKARNDEIGGMAVEPIFP